MIQTFKHRVKTKSKIDLTTKAIRIHCFLNEIPISDTATTILSYLIVYGTKRKTINMLKTMNLTKRTESIDNIITSLRNKGLIIKEEIGCDSFCLGLNFNPHDASLGFIIKLENISPNDRNNQSDK